MLILFHNNKNNSHHFRNLKILLLAATHGLWIYLEYEITGMCEAHPRTARACPRIGGPRRRWSSGRQRPPSASKRARPSRGRRNGRWNSNKYVLWGSIGVPCNLIYFLTTSGLLKCSLSLTLPVGRWSGVWPSPPMGVLERGIRND